MRLFYLFWFYNGLLIGEEVRDNKRDEAIFVLPLYIDFFNHDEITR